MFRNGTSLRLSLAALTIMTGLIAGGCVNSSSTPSGSSNLRVYNPPERSFATDLGITSGPITEEQAKQIALAAADGTVALSVEREDQDGMQVFGVQVDSPAGVQDVKVRISDGAVTQIEDGGDDGNGDGSETDES